MTDAFARLQDALSDRYRLERELGQGGMATVYLAEDLKHHRKVALKVLRPELAATLGPERFLREVTIAANLQHPNILPVHDSGEAAGFLYYVMPFVEGHSLRERLAKEGELPVPEAARILRDVADALSAAHEKGVVHRDIKPENVLLTGRHALVADFGVAKAVSEATGRQTLTTAGVALGTPTYMAPEQAAASPHIDHRADLYAFGVMAYEMLTGQPPFAAATPQALLAAHVTEAPLEVTQRRGTIPAPLAQLIMRCLAKKAADRPQSAEELLPVLEALATTTGGMTPTAVTEISSGTRNAIARNQPMRVVALSVLAALAVLAAVYALVHLVGLPTWLIPATVVVLAVGVPMLIATGQHERRRLIERSTGVLRTTPQQGLTRHLRWRKTVLAGSLAFAGLAVLTGAYMAMRLLGIGPLGTLLAKGALAKRDVIVIADFQNQTPDSLLGRTIQELLRIDLEQSPVVTVLPQARVADALRRMQRAPNTPLTPALAQELAQREGSKGLLTGEVVPVGNGYVVTARLLNAATGEVLTAQRATAESPDGLVGAVDQVSRGLRERIGESLRRVQGGRPLEAVTTASFEALQKYVRALAAARTGEGERSYELLREAIHLDTNFAMAYRVLGTYLGNFGAPRELTVQAVTRAFELRERLPENERLLAEASYYSWVTEDDQRTIATYRTLLDQYPTTGFAWNNLGLVYRRLRRWPEAESAYARAIAVGNPSFSGLMTVLVLDGKIDEAEDVFRRWREASPQYPFLPSYQAEFAILHGDYAAAEAIIRAAVPAWQAGGPQRRYEAASWLWRWALVGGRIREAQRWAADMAAVRREVGVYRLPKALSDALDGFGLAVWYRRGQAAASTAYDAAARSGGLDSVPAASREYPTLVRYCAIAGDVARARQYLDRYEREVTEEGPRTRAQALRRMRGEVALAEHRWPEAIAALRTWQDSAETLDLVVVGYAYDVAGQPDSAIVLYERWLHTPGWRAESDAWWLPRTLHRLGKLHEARGDRRQAREYYQRFADLWKNADIEFQPMVREARAKAARLGGG